MRDSSNEPNDPLRSDWKARRRNGVAPWIAMAVGALLSLGAFVALRQDQNARLALELGHRTTNLKAFFQTRVSELTTASALRGLGRIGGRLVEFDFDFEAALSDFDTLAVAYGGLTYEVEWVPRIESSERADFESETQAEGIEDFQIWEFGPDGERRRASSRPEHFPIRFAAFGTSPRHPNLGFDLASSPIHRRALELARASSSMAVVARIPSEARFSESVELRYLLPIRNDASADKVGPTGEGELIGFVAWSTHMALRDIAIEPMPNAPNARLQQYLESMSELMVAHLARTAGGIEAVLLQTEAVESPESPAGAAARPGLFAAPEEFRAEENCEVAQRPWKLEGFARRELWRAHRAPWPWVASIGGLLASGLLALWIVRWRSRSERIARLVEERTRQLSQANRELESEIDVRQQTERALRERRQVLANVIANIPSYVYWKDRDSLYQGCNERFAKAAGLASPEEIVGKSDLNLAWARERAERLQQCDRRIIESGEPMLNVEETERKADGTEVKLLTNKVPLRDASGEAIGLLGIDTDITQLKADEAEKLRLEEQLRHVQRMDAIGRLAGGVAHDFNNLLTGILGYADLLRANVAADPSIRKASAAIITAAERARNLTHQLLGFARRGKHLIQPVDLHEAVREALRLLERALPKSIAIERRFNAPRPRISGDPSQIEQAIVNLALNARDAMPDGGKLLVETEAIELDPMYCAMHPGSAPGPHICLTVSDTGCGIANESLDRIFEPFFTTKDPGKGTGMGLAMVYGIVKNHGGSIRAYSEPGMGATLKVYLPLAETEPKPTPPEPARAPIAGTGVVLVVDDERVVRDLASDILTSLGYTVVAVNDGLEAIDYYTRHAGEIDLAIVDMIMPRMGGRDCFRALKRIDPNVKAILSTGYSRDGEAQRILDEGMIGFAQKPYTVAQLSEIVSRALQ